MYLHNIGLAGLPFVGADAGGFLRNPDAELYTRRMQVRERGGGVVVLVESCGK